jgi:hypothetical protein
VSWPAFAAACGTVAIIWAVRYGGRGFGRRLLAALARRDDALMVPEERKPHDAPEESPGILPPRSSAPDDLDALVDAISNGESNPAAADLLLWEDELSEVAAIRKHMRRMDRWSR